MANIKDNGCLRRAANYLAVVCFHLVMDVIDRLPQTGNNGVCLKQLHDKLIEHTQYFDKHGQHMPEIRNWI